MILSFRYPADKDGTFTENIVHELLGGIFVDKSGVLPMQTGKILYAEVVKDGKALDLTVTWPDDPRFEFVDVEGIAHLVPKVGGT